METKEKQPETATPVTEEVNAAPPGEPAEPPKPTDKPSGKSEKNDKKSRKQAATDDLEIKLDAAQKELADTKDQYQRMLAEYANYKRRTEQEKEQIGAFTKAELLTGLLSCLDSMEKAIAAEEGEGYKAGVDLVMKQFIESLHKMGLEEVADEGVPFDPNIHNAVMREDADGVEPDTVTQVFQKGYTLGERVLRPAMVKVAN